MGVVTRLVDVINSNINAALDKAEQPEKMIRLVIQELEETLVDVRSHAAKCLAEKKSLTRQAKVFESNISDWLSKAEVAIKKERDDLAKQALIAKTNSEQELAELSKAIDVVEQQLTMISEDANKLQQKLSEAKTKQDELLKRERFSSTRLKVKQSFHKSNLEVLDRKYQGVVKKIEDIESQVEAYDLTSSNMSLKAQFDQLEANDSLDKEMAELKKKVANA